MYNFNFVVETKGFINVTNSRVRCKSDNISQDSNTVTTDHS